MAYCIYLRGLVFYLIYLKFFVISSIALFISFPVLRFSIIVGGDLDNIDIMSEAAYYKKSFIFIVGKIRLVWLAVYLYLILSNIICLVFSGTRVSTKL